MRHRYYWSCGGSGIVPAAAVALIACLGCDDSTTGSPSKDSNVDASPSQNGTGGVGGAIGAGGTGGDLVPTCVSAPPLDCPCGSSCEPDWTNALAHAYGQCDPPCSHPGSCPPMPVGACGDYGVLVSGSDYYFYG